jgi:hypothetical protein
LWYAIWRKQDLARSAAVARWIEGDAMDGFVKRLLASANVT